MVFSGNHFSQNGLLTSLCCQIRLIVGAYWHITGTIASKDDRMEEMLLFMRDNVSETISRTDLAGEFHLAPVYVNTLFKKELAMSPTKVINRENVLRGYAMFTMKD